MDLSKEELLIVTHEKFLTNAFKYWYPLDLLDKMATAAHGKEEYFLCNKSGAEDFLKPFDCTSLKKNLKPLKYDKDSGS